MSAQGPADWPKAGLVAGDARRRNATRGSSGGVRVRPLPYVPGRAEAEDRQSTGEGGRVSARYFSPPIGTGALRKAIPNPARPVTPTMVPMIARP